MSDKPIKDSKQKTAKNDSAPNQVLQDCYDSISEQLDSGQVFTAYQEALKGLQDNPNDYHLREYAALCLLKTGAVIEAKAMVQPILDQLDKNLFNLSNHPNFLRLIADILKETWVYTKEREYLIKSQKFYERHFYDFKNLESGAQSASLAWLLGSDDKCNELAQSVVKLGEDKKNADHYDQQDRMKVLLSIGQAYLLLKQNDLALAMFRRAQEVSTTIFLPIVETLHHLKFLYESGFIVPLQFFDVLKPPRIVVFTGQMMDAPGEKDERFFAEMEPFVKEAIVNSLEEINAKIGYSSASCGSDILFIEAMLERNGEVHIILPFDQADFLTYNVLPAGPRWEARFFKALEKATSVRFATEEKFLGHDMLYRFSNMVLHGMAEMRGNFLLSPPHLLAVWDSKPGSLVGGAADFIDQWGDIGTLHIIDLDTIKEECVKNGFHTQLPSHFHVAHSLPPFFPEGSQNIPRIIKTMLFADISGFSKLKEEHIPPFLEFMAELQKNLKERAPAPLAINTWGDGLFVIMDSPSDLADYAIHLSELVSEISAYTPSLPGLNVRVSLHAGPVYQAKDPFRDIENYYGGHINRAARLEPVTVVGEVYATEQFMALFIREQSNKKGEAYQLKEAFIDRFAYEYIGVVELAKGFGAQPVYHIRWI